MTGENMSEFSVEDALTDTGMEIFSILNLSPIAFSIRKEDFSVMLGGYCGPQDHILRYLYIKRVSELVKKLGKPLIRDERLYNMMEKMREVGSVVREIIEDTPEVQQVGYGTEEFYKRAKIAEVCPHYGDYFCPYNCLILARENR